VEKGGATMTAPATEPELQGGAGPGQHRFSLRVYYEDTDLAGIVYYANYLKFIERARSEWVRAQGVNQALLRSEHGIVFAVRRVEADYLAPARFDDILEVRTSVTDMTAARLILRQKIFRDATPVFTALVTLVALGPTGAPCRLPPAIRDVSA
jgi:acyl-CoA thioester hydrolase